jgi:predicted TIM-barrel fold metal-dependent hydrolase
MTFLSPKAIEAAGIETMPIFDIDTHWAEPVDLWTSRAPDKYKDRIFHVESKADGTQAWFVAGQEVGMIGPSVVRKDMSKQFFMFTLPTMDDMARASTYAEERVAFMDSVGVGAQIVYPNVIGFGSQKLLKVGEDAELRNWHVRTYNDALLELQQKGQGRLLPQAALPLWDIDASIAEIERIRKIGLTGIALSNKPGDFGQKPFYDKSWQRFFSVCQDLELPVNFHIGSGDFEGEKDKWWHPERATRLPDGTLNGPLSIFTAVNNFLQMGTDIMNLVLGGMLEDYPRLKFVIVESGASWLPFLVQGMEHNWREMMTPSDRARFKREPKQMFVEQIYSSYWFEDRNFVDFYINEFGSENLLFETDFPHPTSLYPEVREKAVETLGHHPEEVQRNILYRNAERVYGVPVAGLQAR